MGLVASFGNCCRLSVIPGPIKIAGRGFSLMHLLVSSPMIVVIQCATGEMLIRAGVTERNKASLTKFRFVISIQTASKDTLLPVSLSCHLASIHQRALILFIQTLALYKSFTYLLT